MKRSSILHLQRVFYLHGDIIITHYVDENSKPNLYLFRKFQYVQCISSYILEQHLVLNGSIGLICSQIYLSILTGSRHGLLILCTSLLLLLVGG